MRIRCGMLPARRVGGGGDLVEEGGKGREGTKGGTEREAVEEAVKKEVEEEVEEEQARPDAGASPGKKTCRKCLRACSPSSAMTRSLSTLSSLPTMSARQWGRYLGGEK